MKATLETALPPWRETDTVFVLLRLYLQGQLSEPESISALMRISRYYCIGRHQLEFVDHMYKLQQVLHRKENTM